MLELKGEQDQPAAEEFDPMGMPMRWGRFCTDGTRCR